MASGLRHAPCGEPVRRPSTEQRHSQLAGEAISAVSPELGRVCAHRPADRRRVGVSAKSTKSKPGPPRRAEGRCSQRNVPEAARNTTAERDGRRSPSARARWSAGSRGSGVIPAPGDTGIDRRFDHTGGKGVAQTARLATRPGRSRAATATPRPPTPSATAASRSHPSPTVRPSATRSRRSCDGAPGVNDR